MRGWGCWVCWIGIGGWIDGVLMVEGRRMEGEEEEEERREKREAQVLIQDL